MAPRTASSPRAWRPSEAVRCGEQGFAAGAVQTGFATPQFAVVWILHGAADLRRSGAAPRLVAAGEAFHRLPGEVHDVRFAPGTRTCFAALPAEAMALLGRLGVPGVAEPVIAPGLHPDLARRWRRLAAERARCPTARLAEVGLRILDLVGELHRRAAAGAAGEHAALVARAQEAIAADPAARIVLPALARGIGVSYARLRRACAALGGDPLGRFRIRLRIERAEDLLLDPQRPVAAVAADLGYPDATAFSRQFARTTGLSPTAYRRRAGLGAG